MSNVLTFGIVAHFTGTQARFPPFGLRGEEEVRRNERSRVALLRSSSVNLSELGATKLDRLTSANAILHGFIVFNYRKVVRFLILQRTCLNNKFTKSRCNRILFFTLGLQLYSISL